MATYYTMLKLEVVTVRDMWGVPVATFRVRFHSSKIQAALLGSFVLKGDKNPVG